MSGGAKRRPHARCVALALVALWLAGIAGCGQSGPLTLPGRHAEAAAVPAAGQPARNGDKKKDKDKSDSSEDGR